MLFITVPAADLFDEATQQFVKFDGGALMLEHSLVSLSKWESFTEKPFLGQDPKTREETIEYIKFMNSAPVNSPEIYDHLSASNYNEISRYIDAKMTATWFTETAPSRGHDEVITAEIVYYWMIALQVPIEAQYWHLNRLLTLIKVMNFKNSPAKKMGRQSAAQQRRMLNDQRLAQMNTTG